MGQLGIGMGALGAGVLVGVGVMTLFAWPESERVPSGHSTEAPSDGDQSRELHDRLDRLEAKLDALLKRTNLEARSEVSEPRPDPDPAVTAGEDEVAQRSRDSSELLARIDGLGDRAALREAVRRRREREDPARTRSILERILDRRLEPKDRAATLTELGNLEVQQGRLDQAEAALRRAIGEAGDASDERAWAGYQLAVVLRKRGLPGDGLVEAERALAIPGTNKYVKVHCRWAVATLCQALRRVDRARAECAKLLDEIGDDPDYRWCAEDVTARLEKMK